MPCPTPKYSAALVIGSLKMEKGGGRGGEREMDGKREGGRKMDEK